MFSKTLESSCNTREVSELPSAYNYLDILPISNKVRRKD